MCNHDGIVELMHVLILTITLELFINAIFDREQSISMP